MPFCNVRMYQNKDGDALPNNNSGIKIFYRTYGKGPVKVLMIIGLAGTHDSWGPQIKGLVGTLTPNDEELPAGDRSNGDGGVGADVEVCAFDNRGMGRSSVPTKKSEYTTRIMAKDAIALMDHLGWEKAHVFGHSMGAMIACKLAAMVPERILSLALLNVTGGGYECIPKIDRQTLSIAMRFLRAKTPEQRAAVDLDTHYSQEYVKGISATGMQSNYGFDGQVNACWTHKMSRAELESIRLAGFPISVIHGRHDVIAQLCHAKRLAEKLYPSARMVELNGGHLVSHERTEEVNKALSELIKASESMTSLYEWTNLSNKSSVQKTASDDYENEKVWIQPELLLARPRNFKLQCRKMETLAADGTTEAPTKWEFSCDLEVDYQSEEIARMVHAALAVDKELQPDKVKRQMTVSNGKLSVHFEAVEARFLRASYSAFVDVLTLATKTIEEFGQVMTMTL
ncbi:UNVERIFIED_CONTAM: putative aminoacrylate hydrolase RutD [Sesamum calycinum]|uniref:Aminoacrylate hydrolase RutD n=1 Tax=Sesamum calycinum TaxID=2727403 RepID=A0AAW2LTP1_9LAMI